MIFLKKDRPDAKTAYYGSLPARIRNGWTTKNNKNHNSGNNNNNNKNNSVESRSETSTIPMRSSWRNMRTRNKSEKDKENAFNITGGEYNTVEKDNRNHENVVQNMMMMMTEDEEEDNSQNNTNLAKSSSGGGPIGTEA